MFEMAAPPAITIYTMDIGFPSTLKAQDHFSRGQRPQKPDQYRFAPCKGKPE